LIGDKIRKLRNCFANWMNEDYVHIRDKATHEIIECRTTVFREDKIRYLDNLIKEEMF
jgi:hypothetical protein